MSRVHWGDEGSHGIPLRPHVYYVLPEAWRSEVCRGFDANAIAKAMVAKGWMKRGEGEHLAARYRGRYDPAQ